MALNFGEVRFGEELSVIDLSSNQKNNVPRA
jgi:hypothetical protein